MPVSLVKLMYMLRKVEAKELNDNCQLFIVNPETKVAFGITIAELRRLLK